jgi:hypothetical protein
MFEFLILSVEGLQSGFFTTLLIIILCMPCLVFSCTSHDQAFTNFPYRPSIFLASVGVAISGPMASDICTNFVTIRVLPSFKTSFIICFAAHNFQSYSTNTTPKLFLSASICFRTGSFRPFSAAVLKTSIPQASIDGLALSLFWHPP